MKKFKVTYADGTKGGKISETELMVRYKDEGTEWVNSFIAQIEKQGWAYTRCGTKYELIK